MRKISGTGAEKMLNAYTIQAESLLHTLLSFGGDGAEIHLHWFVEGIRRKHGENSQRSFKLHDTRC